MILRTFYFYKFNLEFIDFPVLKFNCALVHKSFTRYYRLNKLVTHTIKYIRSNLSTTITQFSLKTI